ncbi:hypothetical protein B0T24DRAFT_675992 [Lasiosphaeria ovina]|uniref:Uncharacterized protein n=1 Tax=Lasiosphaeria ovina TaxID=92902 RepID=A0AAE0NEY7_9PEZI|nr:hypothetical protein B0T24DRAFT_675992 [Lasiosphaeria ovina]
MTRLAIFRRGLLTPAANPAVCTPLVLAQSLPRLPLRGAGVRAVSTGAVVPKVAQPSFWKSMVPKPLRRFDGPKKPKSKEWNPATFFIVIFLLIGSMSIQMIVLRKDFGAFTRQSDVRIAQLRDVVERLQKGEAVDVEKALGTGDPEKESEWEEVLQELAREQSSLKPKRRGRQPDASQPLNPNGSTSASPESEPAQEKTPKTKLPGQASFF